MAGLPRRLERVPFLLPLVLVASFPGIVRAQARIDPSLPEAPLPQSARFTIFPAYEAVEHTRGRVPPLTSRQKFEIVYRKVFAPALPIDALFVSGFDQATNLGPAYGSEWGGFGKRFGYNAANCATKPLFAIGIVPAIVHQDPRYFRLGERSGMAKRIRWILLSQVATFGDRGAPMPNYGKLIGYGASTALSNAYMPARSISFPNDMKGYGIKFGVSIAVDAVHEFDLARWAYKHSGGRLPNPASSGQ
jgi:hypothetical protein